jgi:Cu2+-containing amine oxidase
MVLESDKKDKERGYNLTPSSYSINSTSSTNPIKSVSASLFEHKPKVATHPLDDLTEREIKKAVSLIQVVPFSAL